VQRPLPTGLCGLTLAMAALAPCRTAAGQLPVTRADAERTALAAGPRVAIARADTAAARAAIIMARALPNPTVAASYTGSAPTRHVTLDIPIDAPWARGPRVSAANAAGRAARLRFLSERAAALLEVDTTYTRALASQARFRLSRQTARDADSLRTMAVARRNAGDASDLDVDLATVTAGQQSNVASTDSLTFMSTLLTVQTLMGMPADSIAIVLVDSLRLSPAEVGGLLGQADSTLVSMASLAPSGATMPGTPSGFPSSGAAAGPSVPASPLTPSVAAAEASLRSAELAIARERRSVFGVPSLQLGVEWGDPTEDPPSKKTPVIGVSVPLPLFNRNQGGIAQAAAERDRARAELTQARLMARQQLIEGLREIASLRVRVARDQDLVVRAERVAAKSLTAYREGASALPAVLEARRTAREVLGQYIDDLAALMTIQAELRVLTQTVPPE
jgi:cobalt-zinc-cadmium efflux system outer membrane protein